LEVQLIILGARSKSPYFKRSNIVVVDLDPLVKNYEFNSYCYKIIKIGDKELECGVVGAHIIGPIFTICFCILKPFIYFFFLVSNRKFNSRKL